MSENEGLADLLGELAGPAPGDREHKQAQQPISKEAATVLISRWADPHFAFPNVYFEDWEMDVAIVTRHRRLWEVEIKTSMQDWDSDIKKRKWTHPSRSLVSRFYYAVPSSLLYRIPDFVTPEMGILSFADYKIKVVRQAKAVAPPRALNDAEMLKFLESTYYRFWRERNHRFTEDVVERRENSLLYARYFQFVRAQKFLKYGARRSELREFSAALGTVKAEVDAEIAKFSKRK